MLTKVLSALAMSGALFVAGDATYRSVGGCCYAGSECCVPDQECCLPSAADCCSATQECCASGESCCAPR